MTAEEFAKDLVPEFKHRGYKKRRLTWYKRCSATTILFWLQKSQFSHDVWYYNFCVGFNSFYDHDITSYDHCGIWRRFDQVADGKTLTCTDLISFLDVWESTFSDLQNIVALEKAGQLPIDTTLRAREYLAAIDS